MQLRKGTFFTFTVLLFLAWDCFLLTIKSLPLKHPITMRDCNERTYEEISGLLARNLEPTPNVG